MQPRKKSCSVVPRQAPRSNQLSHLRGRSVDAEELDLDENEPVDLTFLPPFARGTENEALFVENAVSRQGTGNCRHWVLQSAMTLRVKKWRCIGTCSRDHIYVEVHTHDACRGSSRDLAAYLQCVHPARNA